MSLHDWSELKGWEGVHHVWITELLRWIKPRLPQGYRVYIGSPPLMAIGEPEGKPEEAAPDIEIAVAALDPPKSLFVSCDGYLVAAVEVVSPRNKDRPDSRAGSASRYAGYLHQGVHLLLV